MSSGVTTAFPISCFKFLNEASQRKCIRIMQESDPKLLCLRESYFDRALLSRKFHDEFRETSNDVFNVKDRDSFTEFYDVTVSFGSSMSLDQFILHQTVETALAQRMLDIDDVSDVWILLWGCNCKCLTEEEAFQTFCAVNDLEMIST